MSSIDVRVACDCISIASTMKPISQRKCKVVKEKRGAIDKEVEKLKNASFITKVKYLN